MNPPRLPPLKALPVFEAVVRLGSLSAAAEALHLTTSAVSQQIRALEAHFGQPLFIRSARGMSVTPDGQRYYEAVHAALERIGQATQQLHHSLGQRPLTLCTTPSLAMQWLIPQLPRFTALHPDIDLHVSTASPSALEQQERSDIDLILHSQPLERPGYHCQHILSDYSIPVAAPAFLREHRIEHPADCLGHPLLHTDPHQWPAWFALAGVEVPPQLPGPLFDHHFLSLQAAVNRLGIALAPASLVQEELRSGRLQILFDQPRLPRPGLHLIHRHDGAQPEATQALIGWLRSLEPVAGL